MNQQYDNTNAGALFKNDKDGNEKRPDYKGQIVINGTEYWLSAWIRTKKDGSGGKFMSLKAEPKQQPQARNECSQHEQAKQNAYQPHLDADGDEIPL